MKTIDKLLNAGKDMKICNYTIKFYAPRKAKIYHYDIFLINVYFGDNLGRGSMFRVQDDGNLERSSYQALKYIIKCMESIGAKEVFQKHDI